MSRWLIQCLTVVTMLASLLHGQCLLSCSLQTPAHATVAAQHLDNGSHSCCPQPDQQKSKDTEKPCQSDSPAIGPAISDAQVNADVALPFVLLDQPGGLLSPPSSSTRLTPDVVFDRSPLGLRSSISILRI